jgi:DDE superfamily endonuclease/Homeodomain-like domain
MKRRKPKTIKLPRADQREIERVLDDGRSEQRVVRRGQVLLAMKNPKTLVQELCQRVGMTRIGIWYLCRRYETMGVGAIYDAPRSGRPREISALERVSIEQLACSEPSGVGLEMTHWSTRSLAKTAMKRGLVAHIAHSTVSLILRNADLQPHRSRYWITPTLNPDFLQQAARILWLYERSEALQAQDEIALALDEKPNIQALQRTHPTQSMRPGQIERQEFEYERHGVVNFLVLLNIYNGKMRSCCLDKNDSEHLCRALPALLRPFHSLRRVHLIWDGGPSHISAATASFLRSRYGSWLRVVFTPAHSSWLNQAEILLKSFEVRYLQRANWNSRQHLIDHLYASTPEYNRLWAQPINWSWTRRDLRHWAEKKLSPLC